jgi:hypothetical protein
MKFLSTVRYRLPDAARGLPAAFPADAVRQLMEMTERGRPEIWKMLRDAIDSGVARRQTSTD